MTTDSAQDQSELCEECGEELDLHCDDCGECNCDGSCTEEVTED